MRASYAMTRDVLTITPGVGLDEAFAIMKLRRIRHLLVVDGGVLVGILSDRDVLLRATPTPDGSVTVPAEPVASAMSPSPITCEATTSVRELVQSMTELQIDAIPVVATGGRVVGIVTSTDLLLLLVDQPEAKGLPFRFRVTEHAVI